MSSYSNISNPSQNRTRPASQVFPVFHSSLQYALVRDFAYPIVHPNHYGPPPEVSAVTTPASEKSRRLSDPETATWDSATSQYSTGPWEGDGFFTHQLLPQMVFGDGPPYSEDEDLHSPVVVSSRQKKKATFPAFVGTQGKGGGRDGSRNSREEHEPNILPSSRGGERGYYAGTNGNGAETIYVNEGDQSANGPGGEYVTYSPNQARNSMLSPNTYSVPGHRDSHFAATLPNRSYNQSKAAEDFDDDPSGIPDDNNDDSRYSKDYQFTIASPDEEMHGKAVALFDFIRENENELPLIEGQVIWVSYRHGQGWLVAEDPKTGESGLVPEEYVRLLRDIEGGWTSLSSEQQQDDRSLTSPSESIMTPTQAESGFGHVAQSSNGHNTGVEKRPPIVSTFSTSSKDLNPYPHHLLGTQAGQTPPQVVHYGSQTNTPILISPPADTNHKREGSTDSRPSRNVPEGEDNENAEDEGGGTNSSTAVQSR